MTSLAAGNRLWDTSSSQTKRKSQCYTASQRLWNADWLWDYFYKYNLLWEILFQQAVPCILARYSKRDSAVRGLSVIAPCAFPSIYLWISLCQPLKKEHRKLSAKKYLNKFCALWMQFKGKMRSQPASLDCYFMLWLWGYWDGKTSELLNFVCFLEILPLCMYKSPQLFPSRKDKHGKQMSPRTGSSESCCLSLRWLVPAIQGFHFPRYHLSTVIIFLFFYFLFFSRPTCK